MYHNIPLELRLLPQWVTVGLNKVPIDPKSGRAADVNNPATWATFEHAIQMDNGNGIGFVFTVNDPYTFIDLDDPAKLTALGPDAVQSATNLNAKIVNAFHTYIELSRSGTGVHIICRGTLPTGSRRDTVEIYSAQRYAIFTGNVLKNIPITEQQHLLNGMYAEMHPVTLTDLQEIPSKLSDQEVVDMASSAINGEKFNKLAYGDWQNDYGSQSEADFALLAIIAFYTPSNEQVRRLFRMSVLGQRAKANRNDKYLDYALRKIRSNEPQPVDLSGMMKLALNGAGPNTLVHHDGDTSTGATSQGQMASLAAADGLPHLPTTVPHQSETAPLEVTITQTPELALPPGLIGQIANYIYSCAHYPLPEAAICGALAFVSGIVGRSYNISRTGLNQYIILLAGTGVGKESAASGIDNLLASVRNIVPGIMQFKGPAVFGSGQGLMRVLQKKPCFFSILGEFGLTLKQLSHPRANNSELMLRRSLLDLYTKSGWGRVLDEMAYSDSDKNTIPVTSPCVTILGESVPNRFYEGLDISNVEEGLVPRFLIIETDTNGSDRNKAAGFAPDKALVEAVAQMATVALAMAANNTCVQVGMDPHGEVVMEAFEKLCDTKRRSAFVGAEKEMWSRAYLKAIKLAGVVAVGCDLHHPTVTADIAHWATGLVQRSTEAFITKFERGELGSGDVQQDPDLRKAIMRYMRMNKAQRRNGKCPLDCVDHDVIPFAYLRDYLRRRTSFKDSKMGVVRAIQSAINDAVEAGILHEISKAQLQQLNIRSKCWAVGEV